MLTIRNIYCVAFILFTFCQSALCQQWLSFTYPDNLFQLSYPSDWDFKQDSKGRKATYTKRNNSDKKIIDATVGVFTSSFTSMDINEYLLGSRQPILKLKDAQILKHEKKSCNNYPGVYSDFTYNDKNVPLHKVSWTIFKDGQHYTVFYLAEDKLDNSYLDLGLKMINSFTITPSLNGSIVKNEEKIDQSRITPANTPDKNKAEKDRNATKIYEDKVGNHLEGVNLLFKDVKTKLSDEEKSQIYQLLKFKLSKDKKEFVIQYDENGENPFIAFVTILDLNGDGIEEIVVAWGNTFTSGMAGNSVTLFIKKNDIYKENLGFNGDVSELIPSIHNGFPDLSISGPSMKIPIWRYNGNEYEFYKAISDAEYKKLKPVTFEAFKKNPKLVLGAETQVNTTLKQPGTSSVIKQMGPNPYAKKLILRRWLTVSKIPSGSNQPEKIAANDSREMEFDAYGKVFVYIDGNLQGAASYIMAPDGKSLLLTKEGEQEQLPIKIISIKPTELIIKFPRFFDDDTVILKPSR